MSHGSDFHLGIDLGTTTSCACLFDGEQLTVVRTADGASLLPSVVRFDGRGNASTGQRARRQLETDPANTRTGFKRLMGSAHQLEFPAAGLRKSPVELSALLLEALRKNVEAQLGVAPQRAVLAVPALFELPQVHATAQAARLAGFAEVQMIQEPVASALAAGFRGDEAGYWLVYDLGGGTFDASLLESSDGQLRVIANDGDNFLGGRDFDRVVAEWIAEELQQLAQTPSGEPRAQRQLRVLAEEAKIELTTARETTLLVPDSITGTETELTVTRATLERLVAPLIDRSLEVCERLLTERQVHRRELAHIVLVGGPTVMPVLRSRVAERLGAPLATGHDPMTLVARGAALFAASTRLSMSVPEPPPEKPITSDAPLANGPRLHASLQYPAITLDLEPLVIGRVDGDATQVASVVLRRTDGAFESVPAPLEAGNVFTASAQLRPRASSTFELLFVDSSGRRHPLAPGTLSILHGAAIEDPPLARTLGVATADDKVRVFFERGSPLPMRRTFTFETVEAAAASGSGYALQIPLVQGEHEAAHLCRLVGRVELPSSELERPLAVGTKLELTLALDRAGGLHASVRVPGTAKSFDHIAQLVTPATSVEALGAGLASVRDRCAELRRQAFRDGAAQHAASLSRAELRLAEVAADLESGAAGDEDSSERARRGILEIEAEVERLEQERSWPETIDSTREELATWMSWIGLHGTESERRSFESLVVDIEKGLVAHDTSKLRRSMATARRLGFAAYLRCPEAWDFEFREAAARISEASDLRRAHRLVEEGRAAVEHGDKAATERAVRGLWALLPPSANDRKLAFNSSVR